MAHRMSGFFMSLPDSGPHDGMYETGSECDQDRAAGPMTGDQSKMGIDLRNGVELAVAEWNERGGVLGKEGRASVGR